MKMEIKKKFKNFPTWLKGGIIGVLVQFSFLFVGFSTYIGARIFIEDTSTFIMTLLRPIISLVIVAFSPSAILTELGIRSYGNEVLLFAFSIMVYFLFGALIGLIISEIKRRKMGIVK